MSTGLQKEIAQFFRGNAFGGMVRKATRREYLVSLGPVFLRMQQQIDLHQVQTATAAPAPAAQTHTPTPTKLPLDSVVALRTYLLAETTPRSAYSPIIRDVEGMNQRDQKGKNVTGLRLLLSFLWLQLVGKRKEARFVVATEKKEEKEEKEKEEQGGGRTFSFHRRGVSLLSPSLDTWWSACFQTEGSVRSDSARKKNHVTAAQILLYLQSRDRLLPYVCVCVKGEEQGQEGGEGDSESACVRSERQEGDDGDDGGEKKKEEEGREEEEGE